MARGRLVGVFGIAGCAGFVAGALGLGLIVGLTLGMPAGEGPESALLDPLAACTGLEVVTPLRGQVEGRIVVGEPGLSVTGPGAEELKHTVSGSGHVVLEMTSEDPSSTAAFVLSCPQLARVQAGRADVVVEPVEAPQLDLETGSGELVLEGFVGGVLRIGIEHSGEVDLRALSVREVRAEARGSGDMSAQGTTERLDLSLYGSGQASLFSLVATTADVHVRGSGDAEVQVSENVVARTENSGDILVCGAATLEPTALGSGEVQRHDCE